MAIRPFLAMTAAELRGISHISTGIAWMACHFSPYCTGLSNLPRKLPQGSMLIVNDITPIHGHDPEFIAQQLRDCVDALGCLGILLDFQRPDCEETAALAKILTEALPCPVGVSDLYADGLDCPVFLPPVPPSESLTTHLSPWQGREVWLEMALNGEIITLTEQGVNVTPLSFGDDVEPCFAEDRLHCHYRIQLEEDAAKFTLWRTREDLDALLEEAEEVGVANAVGLYQELHNFVQAKPSPRGEGGTA